MNYSSRASKGARLFVVETEKPMIRPDNVTKLGEALVGIHRRYNANDVERILNYAFTNRIMDGYPHDYAVILGKFVAKLKKLPPCGKLSPSRDLKGRRPRRRQDKVTAIGAKSKRG
jgi:hypothetical protein